MEPGRLQYMGSVAKELDRNKQLNNNNNNKRFLIVLTGSNIYEKYSINNTLINATDPSLTFSEKFPLTNQPVFEFLQHMYFLLHYIKLLFVL